MYGGEAATDDDQRAGPARRHRDVLLAVDGVTDRPGDRAGADGHLPQLLAAARTVHHEIAVFRALDQKISRRRQHTAVPRAVVRNTPDFLICDRIPGERKALDGDGRRGRGAPRRRILRKIPRHGLIIERRAV